MADDETLATEGAEPGDERSPELPERFTVDTELGRGGMGRVVVARDHALDRTVAIKQALGTSPTDLARFEREARITARLEHPSIVPIHEAGHDSSGRPYYVMRKIEGQPLSERITAAAGVRDRLALVPNVLAAVEAAAFAHARGVIHRDIKPLNILVGAYGETLLIDWGLARELAGDEPDVPGAPSSGDPVLTEAGHAYGTPGYMAPEQARGEPVDPRADVYQLGATLFHVLSGVPPFEGIARSEWLAHAILGAAPAVERIGPEVPVELVAIVVKAMRAEAGDRYRDAGELAVDLRRFLAGQLVAAHRYTPRQLIVRFIRRYRVAVASGAIALVAAVVLGSLAISNIVHERDRANHEHDLASERADLLLLDHAATLAASDPTRAVALLAHLPADSPGWPRARDIASVAAATGIRHGVLTVHPLLSVLEMAPDGKRLLSGGTDAIIQLHELATATTRTLTLPVTHLLEAKWVDDGTIMFSDEHGIYFYDLASGHSRPLVTGIQLRRMWLAAPNHARFIERNKTLTDIAFTGERVVLATGVTELASAGELSFVHAAGALRILDGTRDLVVRDHVENVWGDTSLAISADHSHVAAAIGTTLVELATATGEVTHEVAASLITQLFYRNNDLYAISIDPHGTLYRLAGNRLVDTFRSNLSYVWIADAGEMTALVGDEGTVLAIDAAGLHTLAANRPGTRLAAASPRSPFLAVGSTDGSVSWWNVRAVAPAPIPVPRGSSLCGYDDDSIYLASDLDIVRVDRKSFAVTRFTGTRLPDCAAMIGNHVIGIRGLPTDLVSLDVNTGRVELLHRPFLDRNGDTLWDYLPDRTIIEALHGGAPRRRWRAPAEVVRYAAARPWLVATLEGDTTLRIAEDETTTFVWAPPGATIVGVAATGAVWLTRGLTLWRWRGGFAREMATLASPVLTAFFFGDEMIAALHDGSLWSVGDLGAVQQVDAGRRTTVTGDHLLVSHDLHGITVSYPSGVAVRRNSEGLARSAFGPRDTEVALQYRGSIDDHVVIYADPVPLELGAARTWIDGATNASLDLVTDAMSWR